MSQQGYSPEFKDEAVRQVTERGTRVVSLFYSLIERASWHGRDRVRISLRRLGE